MESEKQKERGSTRDEDKERTLMYVFNSHCHASDKAFEIQSFERREQLRKGGEMQADIQE